MMHRETGGWVGPTWGGRSRDCADVDSAGNLPTEGSPPLGASTAAAACAALVTPAARPAAGDFWMGERRRAIELCCAATAAAAGWARGAAGGEKNAAVEMGTRCEALCSGSIDVSAASRIKCMLCSKSIRAIP